jgi:hypothetical protein
MNKVPAKRGDERDATSRYWKRYLKWGRSERKKIKTRMNRRHRHEVKQNIRTGREDV